jgi:cellulose synthase/poly-beta-1,6-N-acetylglucosamine synthase-like glycosyltransferase
MKIKLIILILLSFSSLFANDIYEWDDNGVPTVSSEKPAEDVKNVTVYDQPIMTVDSNVVSKKDVDDVRSENNANMDQNGYDNSSSMGMGQQDAQPPMYTDYYYDYDGKNRTMWGLPSQNMHYGYSMYSDYGRLGNGANGVIDDHSSRGGGGGHR